MILIAGPCVIEDFDTLQNTAEQLKEAIDGKEIEFYFKSSVLKDNRSFHNYYRGPGFETGIQNLIEIRKKTNVKITTDFHSIEQIEEYGRYVNLIQIPAFLAKQTSLLEAAVISGTPIHIKKPQHLGPVEANLIAHNVYKMGHDMPVIITDRGTTLGYNQTFMDPRHIPTMKQPYSKVLVDVTHPNKNYPYLDTITLTKSLVMSGIAAGANGIFMETHPQCDKALCDAGTMYPLSETKKLIEEAYNLWKYINWT